MSAQKTPAKSAAKPAPSEKPAPRRRRAWHRRVLTRHGLAVGVTLSLCAHILIACLTGVPGPVGLKKHNDRGLEIVLVNAKHKRAPKDAQALAQANLDGGGNNDEKGAMPSSPLPPEDERKEGDSLTEARLRREQLEAIQRELLTTAKAQPNSPSVEKKTKTDQVPNDATPSPAGIDLTRATAIARQEAVVQKAQRDYAERPRKVFVSPRTQSVPQALYMDAWNTKVARVGELNFPRNTVGSLYGSVQIYVEIRADGSLAHAEVLRPDKDPKINDAALRIVHIAAPFASFPPEIRKDWDILSFSRTLTFTREDVTLQ